MARRRTRPTKAAQQARRRRREQQKFVAMVEEMTARYICSTGIALDFANQCDERLEDAEFDLACSGLALDFWSPSLRRHTRLVALLTNLALEQRRHAQVLNGLRDSFHELATEEAEHEHLEPAADYETMLRQRLFDATPDQDAGPDLRGLR